MPAAKKKHLNKASLVSFNLNTHGNVAARSALVSGSTPLTSKPLKDALSTTKKNPADGLGTCCCATAAERWGAHCDGKSGTGIQEPGTTVTYVSQCHKIFF